jgi:DeoR family ulaG and ulaABCDEF operon transcriptional repressor
MRAGTVRGNGITEWCSLRRRRTASRTWHPVFSGPPGNCFFRIASFIGAQGINGSGLLESHPGVVKAVNDFQEHADEVVVLADSSKFSVRARHISLPLSRISALIADEGTNEEDIDMLKGAGINVVIASTRNPID